MLIMDDTTQSSRDDSLPSGRFVLRIDPKLHAFLRAAAEESGLSLNEYCARKLAAPGSSVSGPAVEAMERAVDVLGGALLGVVAFGSWARDEMVERSDVDLLLVVEERTSLTRDLYRKWDAGARLRWDGHPVEPHFVHPPDPEERVSGLWAEAAVEGVILFERDLRLSRRLAEIRRRIAEGRLVRRDASGQPYWVEVA